MWLLNGGGHMPRFAYRVLLLGVSIPLASPAARAHAQAPGSQAFTAGGVALDLTSPQRAMNSFFAALNRFDARAYGTMLTDDATLFFTGPPFPIRRVQGRAAIMKLVTPLFDQL